MDGGGRLLRSLSEAAASVFSGARPGFAGMPAGFDGAALYQPPAPRRRTHVRAGSWRSRTVRGGPGALLLVALFTATGLYGVVRNGDYAAFVQASGSPFDLLAKAAGFPIRAIAITGPKSLEPGEILDAAGISPHNSLLLLNAAEVRERLRAVPLVRDAVVTKLFPDRVTIALDERDPAAIWQSNGKLSIVSGDGVVLDDVHDDRFAKLPFVVGDGANAKVAEFLALLDKAGDLRARIVAGILVADRRWTLKMDSGMQVDLPETGAAEAVTRLVALDQQFKLLDKDLVSIDLRMPGRLTARLSDAAAAARADTLAKKKTKGPTQ